jgi:malate dehydrogenase
LGREKVTIVGAGNVGASVAQWLAAHGVADVVLLDVAEGLAKGKALDLLESMPLNGGGVRLTGGADYALSDGSRVVVITAGIARRPGMSRDDLLQTNMRIIREVVREVVPRSPEACLLLVTNPVDVLTYVAWKESGLPPERVFGMAGVLDAARFRTFIASTLDLSPEDCVASVLGGHGDEMVPLVRYSYAGGVPIEKLLSQEEIARIVERTRMGGGEIVQLLQHSSAYYAPGAAAATMVEAVVREKRRVLSAVAYLDGQYGEKDIYVGVQVIMGGKGVERLIEWDLTEEETAAFHRSVAAVRRPLSALGF